MYMVINWEDKINFCLDERKGKIFIEMGEVRKFLSCSLYLGVLRVGHFLNSTSAIASNAHNFFNRDK